MTETDKQALSGFRDRRAAAHAKLSALPFEPECEDALRRLHPSLEAEVRPLLLGMATQIGNPSSGVWQPSSAKMYLVGLSRLSDTIEPAMGKPKSLRECASTECLAILESKVASGDRGPAYTAISLSAVRMFMNRAHGNCPRAVGKLKREFDDAPRKNNDHRIGDSETYLAAAAALGAVHEVFEIVERVRAWRLARDAALLAFVACDPLRRDEVRLVDKSHVSVRRSRSGATYLSVRTNMQKVNRSRVAIIRDERAVKLLLPLLAASKGSALFRDRAGRRLTNPAVYDILARLGDLAFGQPAGPNIFRKVKAKSAASLRKAAVDLGHAATEERITKRNYRGSRLRQGLILLESLGPIDIQGFRRG